MLNVIFLSLELTEKTCEWCYGIRQVCMLISNLYSSDHLLLIILFLIHCNFCRTRGIRCDYQSLLPWCASMCFGFQHYGSNVIRSSQRVENEGKQTKMNASKPLAAYNNGSHSFIFSVIHPARLKMNAAKFQRWLYRIKLI